MKAIPFFCYLYASLFSLLLTSCATMFNGTTAEIPVVGPDEPVLIAANGIPLIIYRDVNVQRYVEIPRKKPVVITVTYKGSTDSLLLEPKFQSGWIVPAILTYGISGIVDGISGSWNTFGRSTITYDINDSAQLALRDNSLRKPLEVLKNDTAQFYNSVQPERYSVYFYCTFGASTPVEQAPIFFTSVGLMAGYSFHKHLSASISYDNNGCVDCVDYKGDIRSTGDCDITIEHYSGILRGELAGVYGGLHGGWSKIAADSMRNIRTNTTARGFNATLPSFGFSIGYRGSVGFIEFRQLFGTERFSVSNRSTAALRTGTIRCGFGFSF